MKLMTAVLLAILILTGCSSGEQVQYRQISQEEAMEIIDSQENIIILDVRTKEEFEEGHIAGAVNLPNEEIGRENLSLLPDLHQTILVYCRSGNRSRQASSRLAELGYTNVLEFGGINTWTGEIVK